MIEKKEKLDIIANFELQPGDTGSSQVQVALLYNRVKDLTEHCKDHPKDFSCRRQLTHLVSRMKKHLRYIRSNSIESYEMVVKKLGLRK